MAAKGMVGANKLQIDYLQIVKIKLHLGIMKNRIKEFRNSLKISQSELANHFDWSQSRVNHYEQGNRNPGLEECRMLADYLETTVDELFPREQINYKKYRAA